MILNFDTELRNKINIVKHISREILDRKKVRTCDNTRILKFTITRISCLFVFIQLRRQNVTVQEYEILIFHNFFRALPI